MTHERHDRSCGGELLPLGVYELRSHVWDESILGGAQVVISAWRVGELNDDFRLSHGSVSFNCRGAICT
jgi:hypothetical protein